MSDLVPIQNAISAGAVSVGGEAIDAYPLAEVKNAYTSADVPARLMLPAGAAGTGALNFAYESFRATGPATITWRIPELMLWMPQGAGLGLVDVFEPLAEYIGAYADMLKAMKFPTNSSMITGFEPQADVFEWPRESRNFFFGVLMSIDVAEELC